MSSFHLTAPILVSTKSITIFETGSGQRNKDNLFYTSKLVRHSNRLSLLFAVKKSKQSALVFLDLSKIDHLE